MINQFETLQADSKMVFMSHVHIIFPSLYTTEYFRFAHLQTCQNYCLLKLESHFIIQVSSLSLCCNCSLFMTVCQ